MGKALSGSQWPRGHHGKPALGKLGAVVGAKGQQAALGRDWASGGCWGVQGNEGTCDMWGHRYRLWKARGLGSGRCLSICAAVTLISVIMIAVFLAAEGCPAFSALPGGASHFGTNRNSGRFLLGLFPGESCICWDQTQLVLLSARSSPRVQRAISKEINPYMWCSSPSTMNFVAIRFSPGI